MTYRQQLTLYIRIGRSSLARSDIASSSVTNAFPPRSKIFRPPRIDLIGSNTNGKSLSGNEQDRSVHVFSGRSLLPCSRIKEISVIRGSPPRSKIFRPPRIDLVGSIAIGKSLSGNESDRSAHVFSGRSLLPHSRMEEISVVRGSPPRSKIFRPPRIDLIGSTTIGKSLSGNERDRSVHVFSGRSLHPHSRMKEISVVRGSPPRSKIFRPPRIDLIGSTTIGKSLSGNERDRSVRVFSGRSLLPHSRMKEISVVHGSPSRRVVIKPPRQECGTMIHTRRYALVKNKHGCTMPIPECSILTRMETGGLFFRNPSHSWEILHSPPLPGYTLSVRIMKGKGIAARYRQRRSAAV